MLNYKIANNSIPDNLSFVRLVNSSSEISTTDNNVLGYEYQISTNVVRDGNKLLTINL